MYGTRWIEGRLWHRRNAFQQGPAEPTAHVAATGSAAANTTVSSGEGIRRNRPNQQSRSGHNTEITFHEYLPWSDRYVIVHQQISGRAAKHH